MPFADCAVIYQKEYNLEAKLFFKYLLQLILLLLYLIFFGGENIRSYILEAATNTWSPTECSQVSATL